MKILVTGSSGLIGSETVSYFDAQGHEIIGIDNNMRADFFGEKGDTLWNLKRLESETKNFSHYNLDIRDRVGIQEFMLAYRPDAIVHCAAQPSHDLAASRPFDDFDVNAIGTLNLLEAVRNACKESPFVFLSTNKVYGDAPNNIQLIERELRYDYEPAKFKTGIPESFTIDQSKHSLFGASKVAADVMTQEYGRYFGMPTACFRGGCLTGPRHSGVELHGFLNYFVKVAVEGSQYTIFGYKGKQVRDQIHSFDVVRAIEAVISTPRIGEVYNMGGGVDSNASILECIEKVEAITGNKFNYVYSDKNREGDHICYISDLSKFKAHYPNWNLSRFVDDILEEVVENEGARKRLAS